MLTQREIANQEKATYQMQQEAQQLRIDMEKTKGTADMQAQLAQAQVGVEIATQTAEARKKQADGEATYIAETGRAKGAEVEAVGLARAKGFEAQVRALGPGADGDHQRRHGAGRAGREDHAGDPGRRRRRHAGRRRRNPDEVPGRADRIVVGSAGSVRRSRPLVAETTKNP